MLLLDVASVYELRKVECRAVDRTKASSLTVIGFGYDI